MAKNKVEIAGIDTSKLKTLERNELINLLNLYHNGNKEVFIKIVEGNYKLVLSVVQKYNNRIFHLFRQNPPQTKIFRGRVRRFRNLSETRPQHRLFPLFLRPKQVDIRGKNDCYLFRSRYYFLFLSFR